MTRPCHCNRFTPGEDWQPGQCKRCWHARCSPSFHAHWNVSEPIIEIATPPPDPEPLRVVKIDGSKLAGGSPKTNVDGHSNASLLRWDGVLKLFYRHKWSGADVWVTDLDDDTLQPSGPGHRLELFHAHAAFGREDPRAFMFRGQPHVSFVGVEGVGGPTSQLYARLDDRMRVEQIVYPVHAGRKVWEKNWAAYEHENELHVVYTIGPRHVVYRLDGSRIRQTWNEPGPAWAGGVLRGGASPVKVDGQYFSWFHGKKHVGGRLTYTVGAYTMEDKPPFRPLRITPQPILHGDSRTRPHDWQINNCFPCGAILEDGRWLVSYGVHDRWIEIAEFDARDVCRKMQPVTHAPATRTRTCGAC